MSRRALLYRERTQLNYKGTLVLGFGFFGILVIWSIYNSFVPVFLRQYALPWGLVGFVMIFDNILGIGLADGSHQHPNDVPRDGGVYGSGVPPRDRHSLL